MASSALSLGSEWLRPMFEAVGLPKLTDHWHLVVLSTLACVVVDKLSATVSPLLFPKSFRRMKPFQQANWHIHVVSMVHCLFAIYFCIPLINHPRLTYDTMYGYWPYFSDGVAITLGYRPFLNAYGPIFLMFEMSTPFLNIHWFMDKLGLTGSVYQMVNGVLLLVAFFLSRLVFGIYWAGYFYLDVYHNWHRIPTYLALMYVIGNISLNLLNMYWFTKMITAVQSRFTPTTKKVA
ncbi:hypothetical protein IWQ62_002496 [Dispira parvispora]|uniref:TLC domain-containing protein n=1 Tax=Dispira parvispora TaxID=1520584 RepID=A0A9W8AVY2_9FUNG|nr:hypothetical protein IWQ62_002496 [Dispira parvispora]